MHKKIGPDDYVIDAGANYDIVSGTQRKWKLVIPNDVYNEDVIEDLKNLHFGSVPHIITCTLSLWFQSLSPIG